MPEGYKKMKVHFVFDVKYDGRYKAILISSKHLTDIPLLIIHSGVVSLRGTNLLSFILS